MKIVKYIKEKNGKYKLILDNKEEVKLYEDTILKNNLLYKKELTDNELYNIVNDNSIEDIYNRCVKYISVRIRSKKEITEYIKKYTEDSSTIEYILNKLINNNLINDTIFAESFVKDKFKFTTMGPYRIKEELSRHNIDSNIIEESISLITESDLDTKIENQLNKIIKTNKKCSNIRNKVYINLTNLGYPVGLVLNKINKYNL